MSYAIFPIMGKKINETFSFPSSCNNSFCFSSSPDVPVFNQALLTSEQVSTQDPAR